MSRRTTLANLLTWMDLVSVPGTSYAAVLVLTNGDAWRKVYERAARTVVRKSDALATLK